MVAGAGTRKFRFRKSGMRNYSRIRSGGGLRISGRNPRVFERFTSVPRKDNASQLPSGKIGCFALFETKVRLAFEKLDANFGFGCETLRNSQVYLFRAKHLVADVHEFERPATSTRLHEIRTRFLKLMSNSV